MAKGRKKSKGRKRKKSAKSPGPTAFQRFLMKDPVAASRKG